MSSVNCLGKLLRNCSLNNHNTSHYRKQETLKYESTEICFMVCGFNLVFNVAFLLHGLLISVQPPLVDFISQGCRKQKNNNPGFNSQNNVSNFFTFFLTFNSSFVGHRTCLISKSLDFHCWSASFSIFFYS